MASSRTVLYISQRRSSSGSPREAEAPCDRGQRHGNRPGCTGARHLGETRRMTCATTRCRYSHSSRRLQTSARHLEDCCSIFLRGSSSSSKQQSRWGLLLHLFAWQQQQQQQSRWELLFHIFAWQQQQQAAIEVGTIVPSFCVAAAAAAAAAV